MVSISSGRPLNLLESPWGWVDRAGQAAHGAIVVQVQGSLDESILRLALARLQEAHAALRVGLIRHGRRPGLAALEPGARPVSLTVLPRVDTAQAIAIVEDLLLLPFAPGEPLMRVVALLSRERGQVTELVVSSHHAIDDLHSACQRVEALLCACRQVALGQAPSALPAVTWPDLRHESLPPVARGWRGGLRLARYVGRALVEAAGPAPRRLVARPLRDTCESRTRVILRELPAGTAARLRQRCHDEGTRPLGACYAAMLWSAQQRLPAPSGSRFRCETLVDVRRALHPRLPAGQTGCLVGTVATVHAVVRDAGFWPLARAIQADVVAAIHRGDHFHRLRLADRMLPVLLRTGRHATSALSLSYVDAPTLGDGPAPFQARSFWTAASIHGLGPDCFCTVLPFEDRVAWSFSYVEPRLARAWVEDFADGALAILGEVLAHGETPAGLAGGAGREPGRSPERFSGR